MGTNGHRFISDTRITSTHITVGDSSVPTARSHFSSYLRNTTSIFRMPVAPKEHWRRNVSHGPDRAVTVFTRSSAIAKSTARPSCLSVYLMTFIGRQSTYQQLINHFYITGHEKAIEFRKITQKYGHYAVQGHSRSPILVPIESPYTTSY